MSARDKFLSLVEHKTTGRDHGVFRVPTRRDRNMSGTWRELPDGRLLICDHGGDSVAEILGAIGLDWSALFPEDTTHQARPERRPFPAADVLRCVAADAEFLLVLAAGIRRGDPIARSDYERLAPLVGRLYEAARRATS